MEMYCGGVVREVWRCGEGGCQKGGVRKRVEGSDSKQSEMNVQCEQIISTLSPSTTHTNAHMHSFVTRASCVRSQKVGTAK